MNHFKKLSLTVGISLLIGLTLVFIYRYKFDKPLPPSTAHLQYVTPGSFTLIKADDRLLFANEAKTAQITVEGTTQFNKNSSEQDITDSATLAIPIKHVTKVADDLVTYETQNLDGTTLAYYALRFIDDKTFVVVGISSDNANIATQVLDIARSLK